MKHGRITRYTPQEDGSLHIRTEGYAQNLNSITEEIRETFLTTEDTLAQDLKRALDILNTTRSRNYTFEIVSDKQGKPYRIIRTYVIRKEKI